MLTSKNTMPTALFVGQVLSMLSLIPLVLYGTWWQWVTALVMFQLIVTVGISMGYHRYLSHKMFSCPKWFELVMLFFAHIMMVGSAVLWVATHREHHKFTDTWKDPHSPKFKGYFYAHFLQVYTAPRIRFMADLLKSDLYKFQHKYYWEALLIWAGILFLIDPFSIIYAWLAPAGLAKIVGSLVFSFSHRNGAPHSDEWVGIITGGEGYHLEHHKNVRTVRWGRYDLGGYLIETFFKRDGRI